MWLQCTCKHRFTNRRRVELALDHCPTMNHRGAGENLYCTRWAKRWRIPELALSPSGGNCRARGGGRRAAEAEEEAEAAAEAAAEEEELLLGCI